MKRVDSQRVLSPARRCWGSGHHGPVVKPKPLHPWNSEQTLLPQPGVGPIALAETVTALVRVPDAQSQVAPHCVTEDAELPGDAARTPAPFQQLSDQGIASDSR